MHEISGERPKWAVCSPKCSACAPHEVFVRRFPSESKTCILCVLPFSIRVCIFSLSSSGCAKTEIIATKVIVIQSSVIYITFNLLRRMLKFHTVGFMGCINSAGMLVLLTDSLVL